MPAPFNEEILKDIFRWQLQRRQALDAATSMPITVVVVLIGGITYFGREGMDLHWSVGSIVLLVGLTVCASAVALGIISLIRSMWEYSTADLPTPKEIAEYIDQLRKFYAATGAEDVEAATEKRFRAKLAEDYCIAGELNVETNERRAWHLFRARRCIIVGTVALAVSGVGLALAPPKSEDDNNSEKDVAEQSNEPAPAPQTAPAPAPQTQPITTAPQEPVAPPLRICKASQDPSVKFTAVNEGKSEQRGDG